MGFNPNAKGEFAAKGYAATSVADIQRASGLAPGSGALYKHFASKRELLEAPVSEVMDASFPVVEEDASINEVTRRLQASPAVLVETYGRITGIITRHDVLDMPTR